MDDQDTGTPRRRGRKARPVTEPTPADDPHALVCEPVLAEPVVLGPPVPQTIVRPSALALPAPALVKLHARGEVGVPNARRPPQRLQRSEGLVLHCTGGGRPETPGEVLERLRKIHRVHTGLQRWRDVEDPRTGETRRVNQGGRGWVDWGYHWAVDPWGHVWQMLGWGQVGRHAKTAPRSLNLRSHGVVVFGTGDEITEAEQAAILWVVQDHDRRYGPGFVIGHRDVSDKDCPGDAPYALVRALGRPMV